MRRQLILLDNSTIAWRTAAKELLCFDRILEECYSKNLLYGSKEKSLLSADNMTATDFVKSPIENYHTKHIDDKLLFIRDLIYKRVFNIKLVKSVNNWSDIFTKPKNKHGLSIYVNSFL